MNMNISNNFGAQNVNYTSGIGNSASQSSNPTADAAAGALASYMRTNNVSTLEPNDLYSLSENSNSNTPPDVQKAAGYMLNHSNVWNKIETHDDQASDGVSALGNLDQAAQGLIAFPALAAGAEMQGPSSEVDPSSQAGGNGLDPGTIAGGAGAAASPAPVASGTGGTTPTASGLTSSGTLTPHAKDAAGKIAAYMSDNNVSVMDVNKLYQMAHDKSGAVPPEDKKAAKYMLKHLGAFKQIETSDVPGADGKASLADFDNASQGLIGGGLASHRSTPIRSGPSIETGPGPVVPTAPAGMPKNFYNNIDSAPSPA